MDDFAPPDRTSNAGRAAGPQSYRRRAWRHWHWPAGPGARGGQTGSGWPGSPRRPGAAGAGGRNGPNHKSLWLAGLLLALMLGLGVTAVRGGAELADAILLMDAASAVLVIVWAIATWSTIRPLLAHRGETRYWLIGAVGGVGTFALAMAIIQPLVWAIRELGLSQHLAPGYFEIFVSAGYAPWVAVLAVGVYAPLVEELAFRGVILTGLAPSLGARDALWLSSLLFMAWHMQPAMFPHTLALGLLTGTLRLRSGSLYPCILAHGVHNALAMLADWAGW